LDAGAGDRCAAAGFLTNGRALIKLTSAPFGFVQLAKYLVE
jgi:hypothetical protein